MKLPGSDFKSPQVTSMTTLANAVFLCGAVVSLSGAAIAQTQERSGSQANLRPQVGLHLSRERADLGESDTEAIAREKARALVANIKQPVPDGLLI